MARPEQDGTRERKRRDVQEFEVTSNTPLDPQVGSDTIFQAWDFISDKGQVTEKQLRTKFKRLEDNQFDNLVEGLLAETDPESVESVLSEPARRDGEGST